MCVHTQQRHLYIIIAIMAYGVNKYELSFSDTLQW